MGHYECRKCDQRYDLCTCPLAPPAAAVKSSSGVIDYSAAKFQFSSTPPEEQALSMLQHPSNQPQFVADSERLPGSGALGMRRSGMTSLRRLIVEAEDLIEHARQAKATAESMLGRERPPTSKQLWDLMSVCRAIMYRGMDVYNAAYGLEQHVSGDQDPSREDR